MTSHVHRIEERRVPGKLPDGREVVTVIYTAVCACGWQSVSIPAPDEHAGLKAAAISRCAAGARIHRLEKASEG